MAALLTQLDNFYLTQDEIENSPSRAAGVDAETEKRLRVYGCDRIQRAVILLGLPQVVAATAQILLHRFYCKEDVRKWHVRKASVAATYIAVKIEEQHNRVTLRDLVMVFDVLQQRENRSPSVVLANPDSDRFKQIQAEIATQYELGIFKALGFICHVDPPHKVVTNIVGLFFPNEAGLAQVLYDTPDADFSAPGCTCRCACQHYKQDKGDCNTSP